MNYSEMSGDDIAKAVVIAMGGKEMCDGVFLCGNKRYDLSSPHSSFNFDPCNSWADAGPIIENENISLTCHQSRDEWAAIFNRHAMAAHRNPLRAAMIVFLMMQEKK